MEDLAEHPPYEIENAGDEILDLGSDPRPPYYIRQGLRVRRDARRLYGQALLNSLNADEEARRQIRQALALAAEATYWLEDTEYLLEAHRDLHVMGRTAREQFGEDCHLVWTGSGYEQRCPVAIAHKRFGNSPELIVSKKICSLCGDDASECRHIGYHLYAVRGGRVNSPTGRCRVCARETCDHTPEARYLTNPTSIISKIERIEAVAIVSKPRQPTARFVALPVDTKDLAAELGRQFKPGMRVSCEKCLMACEGFTYMRLDG